MGADAVLRAPATLLALALAAAVAVPAQAARISQGAFTMGADALWATGVSGAGETVAVVDEGFGGLDEAVAAGELPPRDRLTLVSFDARFGIDGRNELGLPTQHGVRMAEIVHDVAPGARLVLVNYNTVPEFVRAAEWVAAQGIPIVSHSNSFLDGPFDGTGPAARAVDAAAARGVLWVNSAGNFGQRHWEGVPDPGGTVLPVTVGPGGVWLALHLSWRVPGAAGSLVVESRDAAGSWVPRATAAASGDVSVAVAPFVAEAGEWRVVVRQTSGAPSVFEVFSLTVGFDGANVREGSVATPADAAGALAVAAVPWTGSEPAPYTSWGPTDDGRAKPEIAAPTYVVANPAWPGTAGTSAAAAHVAGAAALERASRRRLGLPHGVADLRAGLIASARDVGPPGPDAVTGAGLVRLDTRPPRLRLRYLRARDAVRVDVTDDGTVDAVEVVVPGRRSAVRVRRARVQVGLRAMPRGTRVVRVMARDMAGNVSRRTIRVTGRGR